MKLVIDVLFSKYYESNMIHLLLIINFLKFPPQIKLEESVTVVLKFRH